MSIPILTTKLYIPPARTELVPRPRLTERLDEGLALPSSLVVISAPPGFGKTTLVSDWIKGGLEIKSQRSNSSRAAQSSSINHYSPKFAWVSLDEQDNDPIRFWSYVVAALDTLQPGVGAGALTLLQSPGPQPLETILTVLINALATVTQPFTLVLDDYHLIEQQPIHEAVTFLLEHLPHQMHLILISRTDPPFPLIRFRVRNRLIELRETDLRFTPGEAAAFLNQVMGLDLSPQALEALEARTEGWIAGLQLAALSMQGRDDTQSFVQAFTGSHRYLIDYLAEEVLSRQPEPVQEFLLKTSILEQMNGPLCDAVLSREAKSSASAQDTLEHLEQANLFIIPLDDQRRWYRYHHLFADFLRTYLPKAYNAAEVAQLHRRAGEWYINDDQPDKAVSHALAAQDNERAIQLVEQLSLDLLIKGEAVTLLEWIARLPQDQVKIRPRLSLTQAWAHLILGHLDQIEPALINAEAVLAAERQSDHTDLSPATADLREMRGEAAAIRSMLLGGQGHYEEAIQLSMQALAELPQQSHVARSVIKMNLGSYYEDLGDLERATEYLHQAIATAKESDTLIIVLTASNLLAEIKQGQARLSEAIAICQQALEYLETYMHQRNQIGQSLPMAGRLHLSLAEIYRKQNQLDRAQVRVDTGMELGRQGRLMGTLHVGHIILAQLHLARGNLTGALKDLEEASRLPQDIAPTSDWSQALQARIWLLQGNVAAAVRWAETCQLPLDDDNFKYAIFPGEYSTLVRVYLAQERFEEATSLLDRMQAVETTRQREGRQAELWLLQALLLYAQGETRQALVPLEQALTVAEKTGYARLFLDEGPPVIELLRYAAGHGLAYPYIQKLLAEFTSIWPSPSSLSIPDRPPAEASRWLESAPAHPADLILIEELTERELEVLRLIADGLSNQEIAETLVIAEGTVKKHIHNIFGKLDVRRRTQVVLRAQELGLL